jgi:hypothetical protein
MAKIMFGAFAAAFLLSCFVSIVAQPAKAKEGTKVSRSAMDLPPW